MELIKSFDELKKITSGLKNKAEKDEKSKIIIKIAMATCSIASGSKAVLDIFNEEMKKQPLESVIKSTGCMGLCHSEPTVQVTKPGSEPVVFGHVDPKRAKLIIEEYIKNGRLIDGVIEVN